MAKLVDLRDYRRAKRRVTFQQHELRQLMNVYSRRVSTGEWRDYAIDMLSGMAVFSVFKHTNDVPLYRIAKLAGRGPGQIEWMVLSGQERLKRSGNLLDALSYFERKLEVVR